MHLLVNMLLTYLRTKDCIDIVLKSKKIEKVISKRQYWPVLFCAVYRVLQQTVVLTAQPRVQQIAYQMRTGNDTN